MTSSPEPEPLSELPHDTAGIWVVDTRSSSYLLDLGRGTVTRYPGTLSSPPAAGRVATLRRDRDDLPLLKVYRCEVGRPLQLLLDLRRDGVATIRHSTDVVNIQQLP